MPLYLGAYDPTVTATYQKNLGYTIGAINVDPAVLAGIQDQYLNLWSSLSSKVGNPDLYTAAMALIANDTYIYPGTTRPSWLADSNAWAIWQSAAAQFKPLTINMANANIAAAQEAAASTQAWLDTLDTAYNATANVAALNPLNLLDTGAKALANPIAPYLMWGGVGLIAYFAFMRR